MRIWRVMLAGIVLGGAGVVVTSAAPAVAAPGRGAAFVTVHHTGEGPPSVAVRNSTRAITTRYGRYARGSIYIDLVGITGSKGNVQLTMLGFVHDVPSCTVRSVVVYASRTRINIKCFEGRVTSDWFQVGISYTNLNDPVSTLFVSTPEFVHLTTASSGARLQTPANQFRSDAYAKKVRVSRLGTGRYSVRIRTGTRDMAAGKGVAFTTAVGSLGRYCNPDSWVPNGPGRDGERDLTIEVRCFDLSGNAANSRFSLVFTLGHQWTFPVGDPRGAAQWVPAPWPEPASDFVGYYGFNTGTGVNTASKSSDADGPVGHIAFGGIAEPEALLSGALLIGAYGGSHRCYGERAPLEFAPNRVSLQVRCHDASGARAEGAYVSSYVVGGPAS